MLALSLSALSSFDESTSVVFGEAASHANTTSVIYVGQVGSADACFNAALHTIENATAFTYFDPKFNHANKKWASGCYARVDGAYKAAKRLLTTSGHIGASPPAVPTPRPAPSPAPGPRPPGSCSVDADCSLNGVCDSSGVCQCDAAWQGPACASFRLLPAERRSGYRLIDDTKWGNTSSWGGGGYFDRTDKRWYMWVTELTDHCGMHTWTTNSQTVRASSDTGTGLYTREAVQFPVWSHEVDVTRGPLGEYVAFFSYNKNPGPSRAACKACTDGSTAASCKKPLAPLIENTDPTFMSWSPSATGNWSEPVMVLGPNVQVDANVATVILANGSLIGMWRDHHPGGHHSTPHIMTAADWKDPTTYKYSSDDLLFSQGGNPGGLEDMYLWVDARGHFHAVFHQMYDCETCTAHAFSADGLNWTYTGTAATADTAYTDGTTETFGHCERPHVIFDESGTKPIALTNGVKLTQAQSGLGNDDQSFTLLRPLAT